MDSFKTSNKNGIKSKKILASNKARQDELRDSEHAHFIR